MNGQLSAKLEAKVTIGKTADELAALAMEQLGDNTACAEVVGVAIVPTMAAGPGTNWEMIAMVRDGASCSADCNLAVMAVEVALQKQYHLTTE